MRHYILFTKEELLAMLNGEEIYHYICEAGETYFMEREAWAKTANCEPDSDEEYL